MQYNKKSVEDIDVSGKKVIARCDFNVPQDENGNITDDKRIRASLETINYLLDHNAAVILCSHLGRPKGEVNMKYSLAPVAKRLSELLGKEVKLAKDVVGEDAKKLAAEVKPGEVVLLENVRFEKGETKNDAALAKAMADMADIYVNDAFGTAHRAHASTAGIADYLPAVCGFLIDRHCYILVTGLLEHAVQRVLDVLPQRLCVRAHDDTALYGRIIGHFSLFNNICVPLREVHVHRRDLADQLFLFCHYSSPFWFAIILSIFSCSFSSASLPQM